MEIKMKNDDKTKGKTVHYGPLWECSMVISILNDAGIEAFLMNDSFATLYPLVAPQEGLSAHVMISENDLEKAEEILKTVTFESSGE
ncbi:MAG: DUF2007 domain-containing protein [Bacteroidales bacterium]|nr:DUF2007 domain-containing protein [Bacteroidales bacterium]MDD4821098.1 DUF2007 domain-containing protein [Bacteroidales bacterium]